MTENGKWIKEKGVRLSDVFFYRKDHKGRKGEWIKDDGGRKIGRTASQNPGLLLALLSRNGGSYHDI